MASMTIEADVDAKRRALLMKPLGVMIALAVAVLMAVALGIVLILMNLGNVQV